MWKLNLRTSNQTVDVRSRLSTVDVWSDSGHNVRSYQTLHQIDVVAPLLHARCFPSDMNRETSYCGLHPDVVRYDVLLLHEQFVISEKEYRENRREAVCVWRREENIAEFFWGAGAAHLLDFI